jgi:Na+/proline symporter
MPWWLLGVSMVATTFSCDTPNLVADIVRQNGVAGNWAWWAFLLTGMLTVFVYAKLWRRSNVLTDLEFYELRYSGKMAAFLRGFRAIYLGVFFNVMVMATVCLALTKISAVMLQWSEVKTLVIAMSITAVYSTIGGLKGVLLTDFFQFFIAMFGSISAAVILLDLPQVGGLQQLIAHQDVVPKLSMLPDFANRDALVTLLILPLAVQWWSVWYPGAEPGGGGLYCPAYAFCQNRKRSHSGHSVFQCSALCPAPLALDYCISGFYYRIS